MHADTAGWHLTHRSSVSPEKIQQQAFPRGSSTVASLDKGEMDYASDPLCRFPQNDISESSQCHLC